MNAAMTYLSDLCSKFGDGWNRFWYAPVDPLPTSVLRIGVGSVAFYLIALFSFDLLQFFGPHGLLPSASVDAIVKATANAALDAKGNPIVYHFSYLDGQHDVGTLQAMHYAGLAVLLAFTVGLWSRVTSVLSLIVFLSYFHRAPMLTGINEPVVAMLLFFLCFAPTGRYLSVDAWLRRRRDAKNAGAIVGQKDPLGGRSFAAAVSLRLIQVHVALIYFLMFLATMHQNDVWWNGTAVWWLMARQETAMVDLRWLADYPYIINAWTTGIVVFYPAFALLIWNRTARPLLIALSAPFWLGIALISGLGPFCFAMFVGGLSFVSAEQWCGLRCCGLCCSKSAAGNTVAAPTAKGA
jgi:hypothetical protein